MVTFLCVNQGCGEDFDMSLRDIQDEVAALGTSEGVPRCPKCNSAKVADGYRCDKCQAVSLRGAHNAIPQFCSGCKQPFSKRLDPNDPNCADPVPVADPHEQAKPLP